MLQPLYAYTNRPWMTNMPSDHPLSDDPLTMPSMIMERMTPNSLMTLETNIVFGVKDSVMVRKIS